MQTTFFRAYRALVFCLVCLVVWSLWTSAQEPQELTSEAAGTVVPGDASQPEAATERARRTPLTFGLDRIPILKETRFAGFPAWQYLASLIYIFLAFFVSRLLDYLIRVYLKRWAERTETKLDDLLVGMLQGPVKVISFVILLYIGLQVFEWSDWLEDVFTKGLVVAVAVSLTYLAIRFVDVLSQQWMRKLFQREEKSFHDQLLPIVRQSLRVFVVVVAGLLTLQNLGLKITAVLGSLGVIGLALSLAAKDTVENFFGAVAVFVDKPFKVGDRIVIENVDGVVETIGLRSTRVRNLDGHLITVPNKTMGNATIRNITLRPNIKTVMNIGITYDTPVAKVQQALGILKEVYKGHPQTGDVWISFKEFADSSLSILVIHWWSSTDYKEYLDGMESLNLAIKRRFDEADIRFAFPTRTLYLKQDSDWRVAGASSASETSATYGTA